MGEALDFSVAQSRIYNPKCQVFKQFNRIERNVLRSRG